MITPEERAELLREFTEHILLILPGVISHLINNITSLKEASEQFYKKNSDLIQHKSVVGPIIEGLEAKYPGKSLEEILDLAAKEAREHLAQRTKLVNAPHAGVEQIARVLGRL